MSRLGAPRNHLALRVSDDRVRLRRSPEAEIYGINSARERKRETKDAPSRLVTNEVWQSESWFSVVELQIL